MSTDMDDDTISLSSSATGPQTPESLDSCVILTHGPIQCSVMTCAALESTIVGIWEEFKRALTPSTPDLTAETQVTNDAELLLQLISHIITDIRSKETANHRTEKLTQALRTFMEYFEAQFDADIHNVLASLDIQHGVKLIYLRDYVQARYVLGHAFHSVRSALFEAAESGQARICAIFGGQGIGDGLLDELRQLLDVYRPLLETFLLTASQHVKALVMSNDLMAHYPHGFQLFEWLDRSSSRQPDSEYLISAPVSFPLTCLLQLAHFKSVCQLLGRTPKQMRRVFTGTTGHSQGILAAVVISAASDWKSFETLTLSALEIAMQVACRCHDTFRTTTVPPAIRQVSEDHGTGMPTPMLNVRHLTRMQVTEVLREINLQLEDSCRVELSLENGPRNFVVSGPPLSLHGLCLRLRSIRAEPSISEARIPSGQRKPQISMSFLPISCPFHSSYLSGAIRQVENKLAHLSIYAGDLAVPVFGTHDGTDLKLARGCHNIIPDLVRMIIETPVHWESATKLEGFTHIVDFGPGGEGGVGNFTEKNKQGLGIQLVVAGLLQGSSQDLLYKPALFDRGLCTPMSSWEDTHAPSLIRMADGSMFVSTKLSRLLRLPPVMVAGMTPTSTSWEFVSAVMKAGYHAELAAGGFHNEKSMTKAISSLVASIPAGCGITVNVIYANPIALKWQIEVLSRLRKEGFPIDGLTIGAGIPSIEIANGYIRDLRLKHMALKPGSRDSINQALQIAAANPDFPIILQWTGGRAGGHHSYEDMHEIILQAYHQIRAHDNVILVAGSGFGGGEDTLPYITGQWSQKYGSPCMPFDGVLLGSRLMVAKEARTSAAAKQTIVDAPGIEDGRWQDCYNGDAGGIMTVTSEMGEPIHKIATRGVRLWAELDATVFSIKNRAARLTQITKVRNYIIQRLNSDFQKVWFAVDHLGKPTELEAMTYYDVAFRLFQLTYIRPSRGWIDASYKQLAHDFLLFAEARFSSSSHSTCVGSFKDFSDPSIHLHTLSQKFPGIQHTTITYQDAQNFVAMCRRSGQKPVPFIPVLDEDLEYWFKKDTLWQSQDLECVVDEDVGRVCILQGPVAVRFSKVVNEPVKEILDGIHNYHKSMILSSRYKNENDLVPSERTFEAGRIRTMDSTITSSIVSISEQQGKIVFAINDLSSEDVPTQDRWLTMISNTLEGPLRWFFMNKTVLQDRRVCENPVRDLFRPRPGTTVEVVHSTTIGSSVVLIELGKMHERRVVVEARPTKTAILELEIFCPAADLPSVGLVLQYSCTNHVDDLHIHEVMQSRTDRIRAFYQKIWFGNREIVLPSSIRGQFHGGEYIVTSEAVSQFVRCVDNGSDAYSARAGKSPNVPLDFAVVIGWKALVAPLFMVDADLLHLVHLTNEFALTTGCTPIYIGDQLRSTSRVTALINKDNGTMIEVRGEVLRGDDAVVTITTQFFYRHAKVDPSTTFQDIPEEEYEVTPKSAVDIAVLKSKAWCTWTSPDISLLKQTLRFKVQSSRHFDQTGNVSSTTSQGVVSVVTEGTEPVEVGKLAFAKSGSGEDPVLGYLKRHGRLRYVPIKLDHPIDVSDETASVKMPVSNRFYSECSGDHNPIHVSIPLATYAGLEAPIAHGMHTSARIRGFVEQLCCSSGIGSFRRWSASFKGMVLPGHEIGIILKHVAMQNGIMIFSVAAVDKSSGEPVLSGEAEIEPPATAYVFTGQGSQQKGMGMDLYKTCKAAQEVWDRADAYFSETYGFRITHIIQQDPKELTIRFGGPRGRRIRENYMRMTYECASATGLGERKRFFPEIDQLTISHTFRSLTGLLSATQFTQPALVLVEMAIYEHLKSRGVVYDKSAFAGHSLGEYAAISAVAKVLPLEALLAVVFFRGLSMQVIVDRDAKGQSNYGMMAVNPSRLKYPVGGEILPLIVQQVAQQSKGFVEIVNYNVIDQQYICAGDLSSLGLLTTFLNLLNTQSISLSTTPAADLSAYLTSELGTIRTPTGALVRGVATIPLPGIDVPFHSSLLKAGVSSFGRILYQLLPHETLNSTRLIGSYVPNVTAKLFGVGKEDFEYAANVTGSKVLGEVLTRWDEVNDVETGKQRLGDLIGSLRQVAMVAA